MGWGKARSCESSKATYSKIAPVLLLVTVVKSGAVMGLAFPSLMRQASLSICVVSPVVRGQLLGVLRAQGPNP